jgi:hypothetical protein
MTCLTTYGAMGKSTGCGAGFLGLTLGSIIYYLCNCRRQLHASVSLPTKGA